MAIICCSYWCYDLGHKFHVGFWYLPDSIYSPNPYPSPSHRFSIEKGFRLQFDQQILLENIITLVYRERESVRLSQRVCIGVAEQYDRKFIFTYIYLHITYNNKNVVLPLTFRLANYWIRSVNVICFKIQHFHIICSTGSWYSIRML